MSKKRGNNEGTINQRSNGTWRAQITLDGRRLGHTGKTRAECQAWLKEAIKQIDSGLTFGGATMKFADYLEYWLKFIKENRRPTTFIQYNIITRRYILPKFGQFRLRDLQPLQIEKYLTQKQSEGAGDRTCQMIYSIMHTALHSAVRKGLIGRNPMEMLEKPKVRNPKPKVTLEPEQIQQFLMAAEGERNATLYLLAIVTGLREGEILGLKWRDINWEKRTLKIQRQVHRIAHQGMVFSSPKTQSGIRIIAIGELTIQRIKEHQAQLKIEKELAGNSWQENDLIFPSTIGTPLDPHNLLKDFKTLLQKAGLPPMRFHDLRHTSITLILNEIGAPVKEAQQRAGHASPSTTINIYGGQATSRLDEIVANQLDDLVIPVKIQLHPDCTKEPSPIY